MNQKRMETMKDRILIGIALAVLVLGALSSVLYIRYYGTVVAPISVGVLSVPPLSGK